MHRRGPATIVLTLMVATLIATVMGASVGQLHSNAVSAAPAVGPTTSVVFASAATAEPEPPTTVSDFYPEDANLSDCVGLVEKPGCGSKQRGGWRQTLVFLAVLSGLAVIGWRISVGVRKNRAG